MTATPIQTNVAQAVPRQGRRRPRGTPSARTITYGDASPPRRTAGRRSSVTLTDADRLDSAGRLARPAAALASRSLQFPMTMEDGEWRIARAPDALIVPESWFEQRFRQVSLYFFDPTAQILVPEPVFVPRGDQLATTLIEALLRGPGGEPGAGRRAASSRPASTFGALGAGLAPTASPTSRSRATAASRPRRPSS